MRPWFSTRLTKNERVKALYVLKALFVFEEDDTSKNIKDRLEMQKNRNGIFTSEMKV